MRCEVQVPKNFFQIFHRGNLENGGNNEDIRDKEEGGRNCDGHEADT